MTQIRELCQFLESIAPLDLQESYDNAGLITGNMDAEITGVTVCLDSTEAVIDDAISKGHNVVVAHHPIVFSGLKRLTGSNYIERTIIKAIQNHVAIYACHTNLDNVLHQGVNQRIAQTLGLINMSILKPKFSGEPLIGAGMVAYLPLPKPTMEFLQEVKTKMQAACLKYTHINKEKVQKIAICGGSGSFLLDDAIRAECDVFITSDFKYHQFFDANDKITIVDIGHFESEQYTIDLINELINNNFSNFAAHCTKVHSNPVNYL